MAVCCSARSGGKQCAGIYPAHCLGAAHAQGAGQVLLGQPCRLPQLAEDIPGLVLESGSFDALLERVRFAVPELLELNAAKASPLTLTFLSERQERLAL